MHIHNTAGDDDETDNDDNRVGWMKVGGGNKSDDSGESSQSSAHCESLRSIRPEITAGTNDVECELYFATCNQLLIITTSHRR